MIPRNHILFFFCPVSSSFSIFQNQYDIGLISAVIAGILLLIWHD